MSVHDFLLLHDTTLVDAIPRADPSNPVYDTIRATPPDGCTVVGMGPYFGLKCVREAPSRWTAVTDLIEEIRDRHGLVFNDLGIEKLYEWYDDDRFGVDVVAQLLAMAAVRAAHVGLPVEDLVRFLRVVAAPGADAVR